MALKRIAFAVAIVVALVTIGTERAVAQTRPSAVSAGVLGGVNLASLSLPQDLVNVDEASGVSVDNRRRIGLLAGVVIDAPVTSVVAFETGAFYSEKGSHVVASAPGAGKAELDLRMIYMDVPATVRVAIASNAPTRVFVLGGAVMGLRVHARQLTELPGEPATSDEFTSELPVFDIALAIGGRVAVGRALFDVRYQHGLRNLADGEDMSVKHRVVSFMAGWIF